MTLTYSPAEAWEALPPAEWDAASAAHLLRRAGWTAIPDEVRRALAEGLPATLDRLFPSSPTRFPPPDLVAATEAQAREMRPRLASLSPADRRVLQRELRERYQASLLDMTVRWLQFSADPANAAFQKWVLFLSDVYVVASDKVPRTALLYRHYDTLARYALGPAPELTKAISRSPAMMIYLDLQTSRREAPNENFARELFELFVLGEGNYTEKDIKESARAFTGYRLRDEGTEFFFAPHQHDPGEKTIFGHTGRFTGDDVIDLAYGTRAAGAFLPHELVKFYLADDMLPPEYLYALGDRWRTDGAYDLRWLARSFFGSRIFFAPEFRGAFIKSPLQYYLGLIQDLQLDVLPAPRFVVNPLRQMNQMLFNPPNVRGWVGGRHWINSASLAARRSLAEFLFAPLNERAFNQDEMLDIVAAKTAGRANFTVAPERFQPLLELPADEAADRLIRALLPVTPNDAFRSRLAAFLGAAPAPPAERLKRLKLAAVSLVESAPYQLC